MNSDQLQQEEPKVVIEESVAQQEVQESESTATAETTVEVVEEERPKIDYSNYSKIELVNALQSILNSDTILKRKDEIGEIRDRFYVIRKEEIETEKKIFEENKEEDEPMDFRPTPDPYESDIRRLTNEFHKLRMENAKQLEATRANNLRAKKEIIEQIKVLGQSDEKFDKMFESFKALQQKFRELGSVPQTEVRNLWDSYNHAVEVFFDFVNIDRELRDLDFRKNMEAKIELCILAEKLGTNDDIIDAFYRLQNLHEKWREIGPVARADREELWKRFSEASQVVNNRHHQYYEDLREKQKVILEQKAQMCEAAEVILNAEYETVKDIRMAADNMLALQKEWKTLGAIHRKEGKEVWDRFRKINDGFFERKRAMEDKMMEGYRANLAKKEKMCEKAEELSTSEDWKRTANQLIQLQKDWQKVGPVPRKESDKVWVRFRKACDMFFNRKNEHYNKLSEGEDENYALKEQLIDEIEKYEPTGSVKEDLVQLKYFQTKWNEIGYVPLKKKEKITLRFRKAINEKYSKISVGEEERRMLTLKMQLDDMAASGEGKNKIFKERDFLARKLKQLETEKQTAENNIGFFTGNKNNPLLMNLSQKVEKIQKQMDDVAKKIAVVDDMLDQMR